MDAPVFSVKEGIIKNLREEDKVKSKPGTETEFHVIMGNPSYLALRERNVEVLLKKITYFCN